MLYWNHILKEIMEIDGLIIYGAGVMGKAVRKCLEEEPYHRKIVAFMVNSLEGNSKEIEGIPVIDIKHGEKYRNMTILVALHERSISEAMDGLEKAGFSRLIPITFDSDEWSDIRGNWFRKWQTERNASYIDLERDLRKNEKNINIYVVHSESDKKLKEKEELRRFEIPIQVGASLTKQVIASVQDNQGSNISEKNKKYCELTALYWIWKNDRSQYAGLCHYRRRFVLNENILDQLANSDIDVILTVPVLNFSGVRRQYCADHCSEDWNIMLEALRLMWPEYMKTADEIQNGIYYYAYNMFIARKEILDMFCEWLFPILFYCEEKIGEKEDGYQNRYIGFLAERLLTIFFVHNQDRYRIAIARKHFIQTEK